MSSTYVLICFENKQVSEIEAAIRAEFGDRALEVPMLGIHVSVECLVDVYKQSDEWLRTHGLMESNLFLREFDILPFSTEVRLACSRGRPVEAVLEIVADLVASTISRRLNARALARIADAEIPFRLYGQNGSIEQDYVRWYEAYMAGRRWLPSSMCEPRARDDAAPSESSRAR
jgi:hypothetical protein